MRRLRAWFPLISTLSLAIVVIALAPADDSAFFRQNCAACHTIGRGRLTSPDLKDVLQRRNRGSLTNWLQSPKGVVDSGDPCAQKGVFFGRGSRIVELGSPIAGRRRARTKPRALLASGGVRQNGRPARSRR